MKTTIKRSYITLLLAACTLGLQAAEDNDTIKHENFGQKLLKPVKWIIHNWSDFDKNYAVPSFYNWAVQLQNSTTFEWLRMSTPEGMTIHMNSRLSNRFGPYLGWRFLFFGTTIDLNALSNSTKRKNEFTLSINSNLVNIDLIRRRTGGDFNINKLLFNSPYFGELDLTELSRIYDLGDYINNSLTGVNINYFTNHKKYSNPAAFSNGAIQLRSVGSPIVGLGFTHQKVESYITDLFTSLSSVMIVDDNSNRIVDDDDLQRLNDLWEQSESDYYKALGVYLDNLWPYLKNNDEYSKLTRTFLTNRIPTVTKVNDLHLQLGYTYNLVFSRRLLLGMSAVISPSLKFISATNKGGLSYEMADQLSALIEKYEGRQVPASEFRFEKKQTHLDANFFARASLTYNFNRWRAGINASFSNYLFKDNKRGMSINNGYGNVDVYVGYCFGRKKDYRYNGPLRKEYIAAALTPQQIEEMKDTMPKGNLNDGSSYLAAMGKTGRYHQDHFDLGIYGCDLVKGPDGNYGSYEIQDGYITPGEDTEGKLKVGTVLPINKNGRFSLQAGHHSGIRAGMWWKSQLGINQIPNQWYPEMLHYALRGKLTLYLRGRIFGTKKPVKVEIEDFCINHGKETQNFFQMGIKSFYSRSTYSIEGRMKVNDRLCRVYIEQKKRGKETMLFFSRVYESNSTWMSLLDGNRTIGSISLPGTHDAGTASLPESPTFKFGHTQNFAVIDQLRDGIRAFDIRLKKDLRYGHTMTCRESFDSTMVDFDKFLKDHPTEFIIAMIGSDEAGHKWDYELTKNYKKLINKYPHLFVEDFKPSDKLDDVRGKILVIRRQEECPFGKLLKFTDNAVFDYDCFHVEDVYKEFKTWKKIKLVEQNIREAYENEDPNKWYITFNSISWSPHRHNPYSYAWGGKAKNIRKPINKNFREFVELKDYTDFGIVFMDFYNDHGDNPQIVETIIKSNFHRQDE